MVNLMIEKILQGVSLVVGAMGAAIIIGLFVAPPSGRSRVIINGQPSDVGRQCLDAGGTIAIKVDDTGRHILQVNCTFLPKP
jgi:hypothetical protein